MIFVTIGTHEVPFDRFIGAIDPLVALDEVVVQHGSSSLRTAGATSIDFLSFDELSDLMRRARIVLTHAGAGSVITALALGKRPIVVPRLQRYGEAVDDHQLWFGRKLAAAGMVTCVEDLDRLFDVVAADAGIPRASARPDERLVETLASYIDSSITSNRR
jgi:beta-1,4-N-acetylglucosaminyltransferase